MVEYLAGHEIKDRFRVEPLWPRPRAGARRHPSGVPSLQERRHLESTKQVPKACNDAVGRQLRPSYLRPLEEATQCSCHEEEIVAFEAGCRLKMHMGHSQHDAPAGYRCTYRWSSTDYPAALSTAAGAGRRRSAPAGRSAPSALRRAARGTPDGPPRAPGTWGACRALVPCS